MFTIMLTYVFTYVYTHKYFVTFYLNIIRTRSIACLTPAQFLNTRQNSSMQIFTNHLVDGLLFKLKIVPAEIV